MRRDRPHLRQKPQIRVHLVAKRLIRIAVAHEHLVRVADVERKEIARFANFGEIAARDDRRAVIHDADHPVDTVSHLVDDSLEKPV